MSTLPITSSVPALFEMEELYSNNRLLRELSTLKSAFTHTTAIFLSAPDSVQLGNSLSHKHLPLWMSGAIF